MSALRDHRHLMKSRTSLPLEQAPVVAVLMEIRCIASSYQFHRSLGQQVTAVAAVGSPYATSCRMTGLRVSSWRARTGWSVPAGRESPCMLGPVACLRSAILSHYGSIRRWPAGLRSLGSPRSPAIESAAARNHASYSRRASTTLMTRSLRARVARPSIVEASSGGQSSSASRTINTPPSSSSLAACQVDEPFQLVFLEKAVALYPDRPRHMRNGFGSGHLRDTPDQDRHGLYFSRPFHYRDDFRHRSAGAFEQIELTRS